MGLTNFPNGVTSFGVPVTQQPPIWLPKGASVYFVSPTSAPGGVGSDDASGDYDRPKRTLQAAVNKVTAGGSTATLGSMVFANPGVYAEQVAIADQRNIKLIGAGIGASRFDLTGVSSPTNANAGGTYAAGPPSVVLASRGVHITGFTFKVVLGAYGLYMGDGAKYNTSYNYVCQDNFIYGNMFDGDSWAGLWGILVDGLKGSHIYQNKFYKLLRGGCLVGSGNQTTSANHFYVNDIDACRGYGVEILAGTVVNQWVTGPANTFTDDVTTALTNPVRYRAAGGPNGYCGNYQLCANDFSLQAGDFQSGNTKGVAGTSVTYVSQA